MSFDIVQWNAWGPGMTGADSWQAWASEPYQPADLALQPDVGFLPAMQRRRLTRLTRMCLAAARPVQGDGPLPLVFGSSHGETPLSFQLLQDLAHGQALSPTQFGLSVHNAIAGQWSILRVDRSETCALAAGRDSLEHAVIEACGLMLGGATDVLVIVAEDLPPSLYQPWIDDIAFPHAVALRLRPGTGWTLDTTAPSRDAARPPPYGHALNLVRALWQGDREMTHDCPSRCWTWRNTA